MITDATSQGQGRIGQRSEKPSAAMAQDIPELPGEVMPQAMPEMQDGQPYTLVDVGLALALDRRMRPETTTRIASYKSSLTMPDRYFKGRLPGIDYCARRPLLGPGREQAREARHMARRMYFAAEKKQPAPAPAHFGTWGWDPMHPTPYD